MKVSARQQLRHHNSSRKRWLQFAMWAAIVLAALFVLTNAALWLAYRQRVLPNVSLGSVPVGNIKYDQLDQKVAIDRLVPSDITFAAQEQSSTMSSDNLGIIVDWPETREQLKRQRSWLPILNLVMHRTVPIDLTIDEPVFEAAQANLKTVFTKAPLPERILFNGQDFAIAAAVPGYQIDEATFKTQVLTDIEQGKQNIQVPTQALEADPTAGRLDADLQALRKKLATKIRFSLNGKTTQPSAADIGAWFVQNDRSMTVSTEKIKAYISSLGTGIVNSTNATSAAMYALDKNTDLTFVLSTTQPPTKYTYCAATKGVDQVHLSGFVAKVAAVLGDPRGWSAGGKVTFERVETDCSFSLWLSAPSQMTSFGGVCDAYYSCRSGRNVVINFDRWQGATDPWNASGGSLEDYRVMVTNHEVGHWLGFGHANCSAPGQPAPVMQQQSISLQGCTFNPWPVAAELSRVH